MYFKRPLVARMKYMFKLILDKSWNQVRGVLFSWIPLSSPIKSWSRKYNLNNSFSVFIFNYANFICLLILSWFLNWCNGRINHMQTQMVSKIRIWLFFFLLHLSMSFVLSACTWTNYLWTMQDQCTIMDTITYSTSTTQKDLYGETLCGPTQYQRIL